MMTINKEMKKLGIYIHLPFCRKRCLYCGFHSNAIGDPDSGRPGAAADAAPAGSLYASGGGSPLAGGIPQMSGAGGLAGAGAPQMSGSGGQAAMSAYTQWIVNRIMEEAKNYRKEYLVDSVFLGGGTPSVMSPAQIEAILGIVRESFVLTSDVEITMEGNPESLDGRKMKRYLGAGVNRLSIGVQSLDNEVLKTLGRIHTAEEAVAKYRLARKAGFRNINIDLMFGIPGQTMEQWMETVRQAIELGPEHISCYSLQIEEDTPFYEAYLNGDLIPMEDGLDREMYHAAIAAFREAGYEHYEISNFAKPGYECRHNLKYWSFEEYLGFGDSASSFIRGARFTEKPRQEYHVNDFEDETSEFVFTGLRKTAGISKADFEARFGRPFWDVFDGRRKYLEEFFESGKLIEEGDNLRLSEEGIDVSNTIMSIFV